MKEKYDVIVIGGGIGGLTCAGTLVKGNKKMLLCEQHSKLGGYLNSFEGNGFIFNGGTQSFSCSNVILPILRELGMLDRIKIVKVIHQIITPDVDLELDSIDSFMSELKRLFPGESDGIEEYFKHIQRIMDGFETYVPTFMHDMMSVKTHLCKV